MIGRFATIALSLLLATSTNAHFNTKPVQSKNTRKASFVSKVMSNAHPLRRLDEEEQEIDLSGYSLKYVKCQYVKSYDEELAQDEDAGSVLAINRFIIFRLCPSSSCSYNYGEYLIDMETYLQAAVEYEQEQQEEMCKYCENVCAQDDDAANRRLRRLSDYELKVDCDVCVDECEAIENMEENGYIDASNFIECQQIGADDDDGGKEYFAGAMCANSGSAIKIGVFLDEDCSQLDSSLSVEDYIDGTLSLKTLKTVYSGSSISCIKPNWEEPKDEDDDKQDEEEEEEEVEMNEMCMELYEGSAKCESKHGFKDGYSNYEGYENQVAQEELVCEFIKTLSAGAYDQSGEIILESKATAIEGATAATGGQKFALTVFILGTVGFAVYAAQLHSQLKKGGASGITEQGAAMA